MNQYATSNRWAEILTEIEGRWPEWQELSTPIERDDWKSRLIGLSKELIVEALRRTRAGYSSKRPELKWVMTAISEIKREQSRRGETDTSEAEWNSWYFNLSKDQQNLTMLYVRIYFAMTDQQSEIQRNRFPTFEELRVKNPLDLRSDLLLENRELVAYAGAMIQWIQEDLRELTAEEYAAARKKYSPLLRRKIEAWGKKLDAVQKEVSGSYDECAEPEEDVRFVHHGLKAVVT